MSRVSGLSRKAYILPKKLNTVSSPKTAPVPLKKIAGGFQGTIDADALAENDLARSGLTVAEMHVTAEIINKPTSGPWKGWLGAAESFPYPDPWSGGWMLDDASGDIYFRQRAVSPILKDFPKYTQRQGSAVRAFFAPNLPGGWKKVFDDTSIDIDFTEGEKKAGKACQQGFATIGLGGVWNFRSKKLNQDFIPDLERINWKGRRSIITFDADPKPETMENTARAAQVLANELIQRGAEVYFNVLPSISDTGKTGVDDFLVVKGAEAFRALRADAEKMELAWKMFYTRSPGGSPIPSIDNVCVALENAPELRGCFKFNEMSEDVDLVRVLPGVSDGDLPRSITDDDVMAVVRWLQRYGSLLNIGKDSVFDAVRLVALTHRFHPIREMLEGLTWDSTPRLHNWLPTYFGADIEDADGKSGEEYLSRVGEMFLVGMVARVYRPGCKMDYTLVLEGFQGAQKSSAAQILAGARYFTDELAEVGRDDVRTAESLTGMWVVELPELSAVRRSDQEAIKAFLTRAEDKFIPKYGRKRVSRKRQCVFIGSTNKSNYLRDGTGARRFWPVRCTKMDLDGLRQVRDQLLAEAYARYQAGAQWWPDREFEKKYIEPEQVKRQEEDGLEYPVVEVLVAHARSGGAGMSVAAILEAIAIPPERRNQAITERVADILRRHGWQRKHTRTGKVWLPPAEEAGVVAPQKGRKSGTAAKSGNVVSLRKAAKY